MRDDVHSLPPTGGTFAPGEEGPPREECAICSHDSLELFKPPCCSRPDSSVRMCCKCIVSITGDRRRACPFCSATIALDNRRDWLALLPVAPSIAVHARPRRASRIRQLVPRDAQRVSSGTHAHGRRDDALEARRSSFGSRLDGSLDDRRHVAMAARSDPAEGRTGVSPTGVVLHVSARSSTGYRGVFEALDDRRSSGTGRKNRILGRFRATFRNKWIGRYDTAVEAAIAYAAALAAQCE